MNPGITREFSGDFPGISREFLVFVENKPGISREFYLFTGRTQFGNTCLENTFGNAASKNGREQSETLHIGTQKLPQIYISNIFLVNLQ